MLILSLNLRRIAINKTKREQVKINELNYNFLEKLPDNDSFETIEISLLSIIDYISDVTDLIELKSFILDNYRDCFSTSIEKRNINALLILYLIDKKKYFDTIKALKNEFVFVNDIPNETASIKQKYAEKILNADTKSDIQSLLQKQSDEIDKLKNTSDIQIAEKVVFILDQMYLEVVDTTDQENSTEDKFIELLDLEKIVISDSIEDERMNINQNLTNEILNLNDADEIIKAKLKHKKILAGYVKKADFIYTVNNLNLEKLNDKKYIELLGNVLVKNNDIEIKKSIIRASVQSENVLWLDYIFKIDKDKEFLFLILDSLMNKYSVMNIDFLSGISEANLIKLKAVMKLNDISVKSFSDDGKYFLFCNENYPPKVKAFDLVKKEILLEFEIESRPKQLRLFNNNSTLLLDYEYKIEMFDIGSKKKIFKLDENSYKLDSYEVAPDGKNIAIIEEKSGWDTEYFLDVITINGNEKVFSYNEESPSWHNSFEFSNNGNYFLVKRRQGYKDSFLKIFDLKNKVLLFEEDIIFCSSFSPDSKFIAVSQDESKIKIISIENFEVLSEITIENEEKQDYYNNDKVIQNTFFSRDNNYLITRSKKDLSIYDLRKKKQVFHFTTSHENIQRLSFINDFQYLYLNEEENYGSFSSKSYSLISLIRMKDFTFIYPFGQGSVNQKIELSPNGRFLISNYNEIIRARDFNSVGKTLNSIIEFSSNDRYLFTNKTLIEIIDLVPKLFYENVLQMFFNGTINDMKIIETAMNKNLAFLSEKDRVRIKKILSKLKDKIGMASNVIEIADNNKPESKEIEIK